MRGPVRNRLFDSATLLFAEKGFDSVSVREICTHATTSINMIHHYFGSKQGLLNAIVETVCEDLRTRGSAIELIDGPKNELEPRSAYGLSDGFIDRLNGLYAPEFVEEILGGTCTAILDGKDDIRVVLSDELKREGISSILLVPLQTRGKTIGVLSLFTNNPYQFSDDEMHLMMSIGEQCSLAIDNAMMFAALKRRYETLVDDFHLWFEHSQSYPQRGSNA